MPVFCWPFPTEFVPLCPREALRGVSVLVLAAGRLQGCGCSAAVPCAVSAGSVSRGCWLLGRSRERGPAPCRHCVLHPQRSLGCRSILLPFAPAPSVCVVFITIISIFSFLSPRSGPQPPPLAGPSPVGCNPRGAPDTVNSPFTRAAELLQTFLLIFTGLKASPFSLIIP